MLSVVSFHTGGAYADHAERLGESLAKFALPHDVVREPDLGSYQANCQHKAAFLARRMAEAPGEDLLWLDADSVVRARPEILLAPLDCDLAVYCHRHEKDVWTGTVLVRATPLAKAAVLRWVGWNRMRPERLDQRNLMFALFDEALPASERPRILRLPREYCWVEWLMRPGSGAAVPTIEHFAIGARERMKRA